jgi:hypothetical protein
VDGSAHKQCQCNPGDLFQANKCKEMDMPHVATACPSTLMQACSGGHHTSMHCCASSVLFLATEAPCFLPSLTSLKSTSRYRVGALPDCRSCHSVVSNPAPSTRT